MARWSTLVRTALSLGLPNIARAAGYRLGVRLGWNPVRQLQGTVPEGPFFGPSQARAVTAPPVEEWQTSARLFSHWPIAVMHEPPDWLANPLTGHRMAAADRPWWQIPDFDAAVGDIKLIWELSRMDWALALSQRVRLGEQGALDRLNSWLADWCAHNRPYQGPNWKCGQEASIRVMHLACAAILLEQCRDALPGLRELLALHLQRIAPTVQYAMAQDNNHGTSEAAALFMGGSWLAALGDTRGDGWATTGRKLLENRAARLIGEHGTFSQYSRNYHRVMLDTFSMAECWRLALDLPAFSTTFQARALAATRWLHTLTDPETGDGPNVGANDGARLLQLSNTVFTDCRPSVQLAMVLFAGKRAYGADGPWNHGLHWLGIPLPPQSAPAPSSLQADDGGFMALHRGEIMALLRYPRFRFRPSQADALHLDLWVGGDNLLRDAGTFSYNTEPKFQNYFGGTASHNTVQFDERDQMPRLSRFLFADWLKTSFLEPLTQDALAMHFAAGYVDGHLASHRRHISLGGSHLRVVDEVTGFTRKAVLRWRMAPGEWKLEGQRLTNGAHVLTVQASMPIVRCALVTGWESRHYLEKTPVPVLEIEVQQPGTLTTEYHWPA
jgi:hypothetical protein